MRKLSFVSMLTLVAFFASSSVSLALTDRFEWKSLHSNATNDTAITILEDAMEAYRNVYDKEKNAIPTPKPGFFHEPNQLRQHYSFAFAWTTDIAEYDWWKSSADANIEMQVATSATQWTPMAPASKVSTIVETIQLEGNDVLVHTDEPNPAELSFVAEMFCESYRGQVDVDLFFRNADFLFRDKAEREKLQQQFLTPFAEVFYASEVCKGDGAGAVEWEGFITTNDNGSSVPFQGSGENATEKTETKEETTMDSATEETTKAGTEDDSSVSQKEEEAEKTEARVNCFDDTKGDKFENAICWVKEQGVVEGYEDKTYKSGQKINRAEFTKILMASEHTEAEIGTMDNCFNDVKKEWFAPYVCFAEKKGVIKGYEDKTFKPAANVNLAEALKIASEAKGYELEDKQDAAWYEKYMDFAKEKGIFETVDSDPAHEVTRGEMAEIIFLLSVQ